MCGVYLYRKIPHRKTLLWNKKIPAKRGTSGVTVMGRAMVPMRLEIAQTGAFLAATRAVIGDDVGG